MRENAPPAVEITGLVKEFRVYHRSYGSLKSHAAALAKNLIRREVTSAYEIRRALDGVTFRIAPGETVALIGRNGSGKSTLLSILSRIYLPTAGEARLNGRMMSLLELGAGFDSELTGAQNVFFNGVVLGLDEDQVAARYDAILDFAELDRQAMDLPVRMYSSGMQLRLGFAIAVHLEADLLLVDEGLAVGDEGFQEKCFRKMEEFHAQGKTILMVTHELDHVERLAQRVLWLDGGRIRRDGPVADVLAEYRGPSAMTDEAGESPIPAGKPATLPWRNCTRPEGRDRPGTNVNGPGIGPDLSVAVVSYNTKDLLRACLASLRDREADGEARLEIIVADNGSDDGSLEMARAEFPGVRVVETGGNVGFGRANNLALRDARGRHFCLLNSDAEALPGALRGALAFLDARPDVGLAGGQLLWPDGRAQTSWGNDPTLAGVWQEQTFQGALPGRRPPATVPAPPAPRDVDQISGAFMAIRREAWHQIGGFDPAYFMYNEDVDLNVRLRRAGWRVVFLPDVRIRHHLGASSRADWRTRARMVSAYNESRALYFARYEGQAAARRLRAYCLLGAAIRLTGWTLLAAAKPAARDKVRLFREVWRRTWAMGTSGTPGQEGL